MKSAPKVGTGRPNQTSQLGGYHSPLCTSAASGTPEKA